MQISFVAQKRIFMQPGNVIVNQGDILVFDPSNNNSLTVFRAQKIVGTVKQTALGLEGLRTSGLIDLIDTEPAPLSPGSPVDPEQGTAESKEEKAFDAAVNEERTEADFDVEATEQKESNEASESAAKDDWTPALAEEEAYEKDSETGESTPQEDGGDGEPTGQTEEAEPASDATDAPKEKPASKKKNRS